MLPYGYGALPACSMTLLTMLRNSLTLNGFWKYEHPMLLSQLSVSGRTSAVKNIVLPLCSGHFLSNASANVWPEDTGARGSAMIKS